MKEYRICTNCVMDTSDEFIEFDSEGLCNHCRNFNDVTSKKWFPNEIGLQKLDKLLKKVKSAGENSEYDCILGLSGGIDSSYLALKIKDWGLRPLVIHVDAGWNSELAVYNIEKVVEYCNFDLHTEVIDWEAMKDLQLAYFKSGISNQDVPQDHIFFSTLYHFATKNKIKYILSGGNIATESIFPSSWHGNAMDAINLKSIYKKFSGKKRLKNYKTINFFKYYIYFPFFYKMKTLRPLNFMEYNKEKAIKELEKIGYKKYHGKHGESIFTKFFQTYYLPKKFGFDKRRPHLSSLIVSGQITRKQALNELEKPLFDPVEIKHDIQYIAKKLGISSIEFENLIQNENRLFSDYPNWVLLQKIFRTMKKIFNIITGKDVAIYH